MLEGVPAYSKIVFENVSQVVEPDRNICAVQIFQQLCGQGYQRSGNSNEIFGSVVTQAFDTLDDGKIWLCPVKQFCSRGLQARFEPGNKLNCAYFGSGRNFSAGGAASHKIG